MEWIARTGAVEPSQVMYLFKMGRTVTYRRLAALQAAGLLDRARLLHGQPGLIVATRAGLGLVGLEHLGLTRVSAATATHWQSSSLVAVLLERRVGRGGVGSVREIRAAERATKQPVASTMIGAASHHPDLVRWGPEGPGQPGGIAIEVELTAKAPERLRAILRGWDRARMNATITRVDYICSPGAQRAVTRAVEATNTQHLVRVLEMPALDVLPRLTKAGQ